MAVSHIFSFSVWLASYDRAIADGSPFNIAYFVYSDSALHAPKLSVACLPGRYAEGFATLSMRPDHPPFGSEGARNYTSHHARQKSLIFNTRLRPLTATHATSSAHGRNLPAANQQPLLKNAAATFTSFLSDALLLSLRVSRRAG
jgi:hypothetical protein